MPITATPDHVAVAVPSIDAAAGRWHDDLGGGWSGPAVAVEPGGFTVRQLRFSNGARLELLEALGAGSFVRRFLARHGSRVHHVTLRVPDLLAAAQQVRDEGYDVVDVSTASDAWHEAFLRPSQVGGLVVQLAWSGDDPDERAHRTGSEPPRADAPALLGPSLSHTDLAAAARVWTTLGGTIATSDDVLEVTWPSGLLDVRVERDPGTRAVGLRFRGAPALPDDATAGPRVLPVDTPGTAAGTRGDRTV